MNAAPRGRRVSVWLDLLGEARWGIWTGWGNLGGAVRGWGVVGGWVRRLSPMRADGVVRPDLFGLKVTLLQMPHATPSSPPIHHVTNKPSQALGHWGR